VAGARAAEAGVEIERSAASVEEAVEAALSELGISEQEAVIEIVQEPKGGLLGIGSHPAVVRVRSKRPAPVQEDAEAEEEIDEQAEAAADFLQGLLEAIGLDADVEIHDDRGITYVEIWGGEDGEDMGLLIGKHGHTLDAVQELVRGYVQRRVGGRCLVQVDVEDYRKRRLSRVQATARDVGKRVKRSGRPEALEAMGAFERKLVHDTIAELGGLETASEGEEPHRHVVIRRQAR
jgi:spoIIIJ-associated protein